MLKILLVITLVVSALSLSLTSHTQAGLPGGWFDSTAVQPQIDAYIRNNVPALANAQWVSGKKQVVAGFNYSYKYKKGNETWNVDLFDQPWTSNRAITKVNKTVETNVNGQTKKEVTGVSSELRDFTQAVRSRLV